jgi:glutathione S-transferase
MNAMIRYFRMPNDGDSTVIQDALDELCMAHETVVLESAEELRADLTGQGRPPILVDGHNVITGSDHILTHLEELSRFKKQWYRFQSDACYCDEQGSVE